MHDTYCGWLSLCTWCYYWWSHCSFICLHEGIIGRYFYQGYWQETVWVSSFQVRPYYWSFPSPTWRGEGGIVLRSFLILGILILIFMWVKIYFLYFIGLLWYILKNTSMRTQRKLTLQHILQMAISASESFQRERLTVRFSLLIGVSRRNTHFWRCKH